MRRTDKMGDELNENLRKDGLKLGKAALLARIFFLPAAAGLLCLFLLNFLVITSALVSVSVGILCAPIGALYLLGAIGVVLSLLRVLPLFFYRPFFPFLPETFPALFYGA